MNHLLPTRIAVAAAVVAAVAAAPAFAQNTTSAMRGQVLGADGRPVARATVTIRHVESGSTTNITTESDGSWVARGLRAGGPYTITVSQGGRTETRSDVFLALAETQTLDLTLGAPAQTITITGAAANDRINRGSMGATTAIGVRELNTYASIQRNLQDYARSDPRLSQTEKERGEIAVAGQNSRFNSITIDGVRINDTFGLEANNLPTIKQPISIDAIQAVQVNVSNYDVTQQGYTGANINAVTKSGTNEFKGSIYYVYRDDQLSGDRFFRRPDRYVNPPVFEDTTTGFTLGGPIVKDKLFFFVNYEELKSNRNAPTFGPIGSGLTEVGVTPAEIAAARAAATAKGFDIGTFSQQGDLSVKDALFKLDWNISDNHRAKLLYTKTEEANPIFPGFSGTTFSLSSRNYITAKTVDSLVGQINSDWTDTFSTEFKLSKREYTSFPITNSNLPEIQFVFTAAAPAGTATGNRTMRVGTEETRHFNRIETDTTNAYLGANWNIGPHEVKFGADVEKNDVFNLFVRRAKGQYTFQGADPVALFIANNPTAYRVQVARPGFTLADAAADLTLSNTGVFLQDTWNVNRALTVMAGLRVDVLGANKEPIYNAAAQTAFGYDNRETIDGKKLVQPRFGFNYRLSSDAERRSQVRGGFGLFQGSAATVWLVNPYQNTGMVLSDTSCSTTTNPVCPPGLFSADPNNPATLANRALTSNVDFLAPGTNQPSVWKMNLAFDTELPGGFTLGAEWLHTEVKQGLTYRHLNLGAATAFGPDGREIYWSAGGRNPACYTGAETPITTGACATSTSNPQQRPVTRFNANANFADVLIVEPTKSGRGDAVTVQIAQNLRQLGANWSLAYTRTTATEVSPLTSSTSFSQWANRASFNPNEAVSANSGSLIRNRVNASFSWSRAFISTYRTSLGVFYEGRDGRPYSWTFNNDLNGDGISGNDLLYVPRGPGSGEVLFRLPNQTVAASGAQAEAAFWSIVDGNRALSRSKGSVIGRNADTSPFTHNWDVRLSQEVPGFSSKHKGVISFDILNFGNLLNKKWGRIDEIGFSDGSGGLVRRWINYAGTQDGKMVYAVNDPFTVTTKNNRGESAWAVQITARYEF